jgi:glycine/D-amino acid oxidase-like deaminating enzyme/nitrite reductase/ring-hydroxylating ferredoxin subunit
MLRSQRMIPGRRESVWIATAPSPPRSSLSGTIEADVAVIGAGIVGLTAARALQAAGLAVVVIESGTVGAGVSGQTTAKVTSQHGLSYHALVARHGEEGVREHALANQAAVAAVRDAAAGAQWVDAPNYVYTTVAQRADEVAKEAETCAALGLPARATSETELPFEVGAAVRFDGQGHFHPRKYLLTLAEGLERAGVRILEQSRVVAIEDGAPCRVRTAGGDVQAKHVVVATNVPILDDWFYVTRMQVKREYGLAVQAPSGAPTGMYVSADQPRRSVRPFTGPDGPMLVFVGESHALGDARSERHIEELVHFSHLFQAGPPQYHWSSQDYYPLDDLPLVGRYTPRAKHTWAATGFRAWGMTQGHVAGNLLADLVVGKENPLAQLYDPFNPRRILRTTITSRMLHSGATIADRLVAQRFKPGERGELQPGEGHIENRGLHKAAVCLTRDGQRHVLSAACTHKGCIVAWNSLEQSWDCPCHGSRFAPDGSVLRGPTVKPLPGLDG